MRVTQYLKSHLQNIKTIKLNTSFYHCKEKLQLIPLQTLIHFKHSEFSSFAETMNHSILFLNQIFQHFHSVMMQGFDIDI